MLESISSPWPWYVSGPLIAITMFVLLYLGRSFGVSSNLRTMCAAAGAGKVNNFFNISIKDNLWNLLFVLGGLIGGFIAANYIQDSEEAYTVSESTNSDLSDLGFSVNDASQAKHMVAPSEWFGNEALSNPAAWAVWIIGGLLVGFGARYAGGCTSGHAISGLSNLQIPSLIAVIGFFIGGLTMTFILFPLIF